METERVKQNVFLKVNPYAIPGLKRGARTIKEDPAINIYKQAIKAAHNLSFNQYNVDSRKREIVEARQHLMFLVHLKSKYSLSDNGSIYFKNFDHSTVIHAKQTWLDLLDTSSRHRELHRIALDYIQNYRDPK